MKTFFIEVNGSNRAGPLRGHVNNAMLDLFERLPGANVIKTFRKVDSESPVARYVRTDAGIVWFAPIKSRKAPTHKTVTDKVTGKRCKVAIKDPRVHRSSRVGEWVRVGVLEFTEPDPQADRPTSVCQDDFLTDLIENKWVM